MGSRAAGSRSGSRSSALRHWTLVLVRETQITHPVVPERDRVGLPTEADLEVGVVADKRRRVSGRSRSETRTAEGAAEK